MRGEDGGEGGGGPAEGAGRGARLPGRHLTPPPSPLPRPPPPTFSRARSFPGLYESLHDKVRGQWDTATWAQYLAYKAKVTPLPWDPNHGDVTEEKMKEIKAAIANKAGVTPAQLGW